MASLSPADTGRHGTVPPVQMETVHLTTSDDVTIAADLVAPSSPRGAIAIAHPHPLYGGNRSSHVVGSLFDAALAIGWAAIRFDFRGAGGSGGAHDGGRAERLDLTAALAAVAPYAGPGPVVAAGYSFGALVALDIADETLAGWLAIAPPLGIRADPLLPAGLAPQPKLILSPAHDQFTSPAETTELTAGWLNTTVTEIEMADHFLNGRAHFTAQLAMEFLSSL